MRRPLIVCTLIGRLILSSNYSALFLMHSNPSSFLLYALDLLCFWSWFISQYCLAFAVLLGRYLHDSACIYIYIYIYICMGWLGDPDLLQYAPCNSCFLWASSHHIATIEVAASNLDGMLVQFTTSVAPVFNATIFVIGMTAALIRWWPSKQHRVWLEKSL